MVASKQTRRAVLGHSDSLIAEICVGDDTTVQLWQAAGLDLQMSCYRCTATDVAAGLIEVVPNARTVAHIQKVCSAPAARRLLAYLHHPSSTGQEASRVTGALKKTPLAKWLRENNPAESAYQKAVDNFVATCAGYCVATYVLGIGDRHNDNIMITSTGHLFRT